MPEPTAKQAAITTFIQKSPVPAESHAKEFFKAVMHTFVGIAVVSLGIFCSHQQVPWEVWVPICATGFVIIAPRTIKGAVQYVWATVKDIKAGKDTGPSDSQ
jgi:hypothetical protein